MVETLENGEQQELITVFSMVPSSWVSSDLRNMLYPQPNFTVGGKQPSDWGEKTFKRHQCPLTSWIEYDIQKIFNPEKPGNNVRLFLWHTKDGFPFAQATYFPFLKSSQLEERRLTILYL